jgi:hypothetical protein
MTGNGFPLNLTSTGKWAVPPCTLCTNEAFWPGGSTAQQQEESMTKKPTKPAIKPDEHYDSILGDISNVIDAARRSAARSVNCIMTAAYWLIGRHIFEFEQKGFRASRLR